jgi:hypothetical protein
MAALSTTAGSRSKAARKPVVMTLGFFKGKTARGGATTEAATKDSARNRQTETKRESWRSWPQYRSA